MGSYGQGYGDMDGASLNVDTAVFGAGMFALRSKRERERQRKGQRKGQRKRKEGWERNAQRTA